MSTTNGLHNPSPPGWLVGVRVALAALGTLRTEKRDAGWEAWLDHTYEGVPPLTASGAEEAYAIKALWDGHRGHAGSRTLRLRAAAGARGGEQKEVVRG